MIGNKLRNRSHPVMLIFIKLSQAHSITIMIGEDQLENITLWWVYLNDYCVPDIFKIM